MAIEVFMPKNGMSQEEGTIVRWLKEVGDKVEFNEPIMEIETDKVTMEAESPGTGILLAKLYEDGDVVPVLKTIGYIGEEGEKVPNKNESSEETVGEEKENNDKKPEISVQPVSENDLETSGEDIPSTPYAKTLAKEKNIDMSKIKPSGKKGEIVAKDILEAKVIKSTPLAKAIADDLGLDIRDISGSGYNGKVTRNDILTNQKNDIKESLDRVIRKPITGMRKVIKERMVKSYFEIPVVTINMDVDMSELIKTRETINSKKEKRDKISINDFILKSSAIAVKEFELIRTTIEEDEFVIYPSSNIGMAVGTAEGSLIVPVIFDADQLSLTEVSKAAKDLAGRGRAGGLKSNEYIGSTFTVSNMGMYGVKSFTPIINQPNAAILGVCSIRDEFKLVNGQVIETKLMNLSLTFDHRILDGVGSAVFLQRIKYLLENPLEMLI